MFRHERPQSGRMRQHHQFGVEIFGDNSSEADAEIILIGLTYLKKLQFQHPGLPIKFLRQLMKLELILP